MNRDRSRLQAESSHLGRTLSRRDFVHKGAFATAGLGLTPILQWQTAAAEWGSSWFGPAKWKLPFNRDWQFGGGIDANTDMTNGNERKFVPVTLPHCVAKLSWRNWDPAAWEQLWSYRRQFMLPAEFRRSRVFVQFEGVMVGVTPKINGQALPEHLGGYLPANYEITEWLKAGENTLDVTVNSRWSNVPPEGSPQGPKGIDYLEVGGIYRSVWLEAVPQIFIRDVFAKPVEVLNPSRRVEVSCTIDGDAPAKRVELQVEMRDGARVVARARQPLSFEEPGDKQALLTLSNLGKVSLWDGDKPHLYIVIATLLVDGTPVHDYRVRIGLRDARFELNGFYLNGRRVQLFGLNRHEIYPYVGGAMPARVMRRDAEMLRREFHCNIVRCSHYPQSEAFLNACDELGLMVWEETPGWGYLGDEAWKELLVRDVHDMIIRDRNHAAIVIWGVRANESANDVPLYLRTTEVAKQLDDSRPDSGSMTWGSRTNWKRDWHEDVFAFDNYRAKPDGSVAIDDPVEGVPYMLAEAVGQFNYTNRKGFDSYYRRAGDVVTQQLQAVRHAQAHSRAAANPRICGTIAWCAFDYPSLVNCYKGVKTPGIADVFRIPKLGASFYLAQGNPNIRPVIYPNFYWDFGPQNPNGPGKHVAIFSNCNRLEVFVAGKLHARLSPDVANFPNLMYAPFFTDLDLDGVGHPELRIDGYVGNRQLLVRRFSSDPSTDQFLLAADDVALIGDGADSTRVVFKITDKYGADRAFAGGEVQFKIEGPGVIVGDNPFSLVDSGGVGAIWIRTVPGGRGKVRLSAKHPTVGEKLVEIDVGLPEQYAVGGFCY